MILVIDNYDSFTYNIVQLIGELGAEIEVVRNDQITVEGVRTMAPDQIIISPGPGYPSDSGVSRDVILELGPSVPVLGVCLGHQCIGEVYGGIVTHAQSLMHGKTSMVYHKHDDLFTGVPSPFEATRYHSLVVKEETLPDSLEITAFTEDGEIMGLRHKEYPVMGVQFHPESILTGFGKRILQNFLQFEVTAVRG
ncbi:aminodeoxychorismate/anthranilate synthase component II [Phototrophicus methaneseepsis]|uniref:Aminodeoxychorismate/anthranilate synthase component II n=1 Tax=Phototrophicus methaneseepsis TaxID=2710758 RepID=A0A7S8E5N8_9CHLR|nr:aminodeoxychorismate/anthranilate synthase component II [Phototrophicus methaneseepsis]QPC80768.1 aminodeoxychorismate/anthranilate synthase component II [Phototrophicus methaneseepsis]